MLAEPKLEDRPFQVLTWTAPQSRRLLVLSPCVGISTHYMKRTLICGGVECPACKCGIAGKYAGYVVVFSSGRNRLLRLTQGPSLVGAEGGLFSPGRVLIVQKLRERHGLTLTPDGDVVGADRWSFHTRLQLLSIVARLHGLPVVPEEMTEEEAIEVVHSNACTSLRLAMSGKAE